MTETPLDRDHLRNVIAAAIWRRITRDDGSWDEQLPIHREEFIDDADAVLTALVAEGYRLPEKVDLTPESAVDILAREAAYKLTLADAGLLWEDYPDIGETDWEAVVVRVLDRAKADKPEPAELVDAYEFLSARADAGACAS